MLLSEKIQANLLRRKAAEPVKPAPKRRSIAKRKQLSPADPYRRPAPVRRPSPADPWVEPWDGVVIGGGFLVVLFTLLGIVGFPSFLFLNALGALAVWWANR